MQDKRVPLRKCTGCREMRSKVELIRIVKSKDLGISIDFEGKKSGRGAYVCKNLDCLRRARKMRKFEKSFSCKVPDEVYESLEEELENE